MQFFLDHVEVILCLWFCVLHFFIDLFNARRLGKKITRLCDRCFSPVVEGEEHSCALSDSQLNALAAFVSSIKDKKE